MKALWKCCAISALVMLGGCGVASVGYDLDKLNAVQPSGDAFTSALTDEYRQLAAFEADEMKDWKDASYYARKGQRTAAGEAVQPQEISARDLPADHVAELTTARGDLMSLLGAGASAKVPARAARAQAKFDCWMEQQEENFQPEHIASCRDEFYAALNESKLAMVPPPAPAMTAMTAIPARFIVYFPFNSDKLSAESVKTIETATAAAAKGKLDFSVTGHADRAGTEDYNMALSLKRADAVRNLLGTKSLGGSKISVGGQGEAEPAVATQDGVKEQANRRVEIILLK
ncbi:MAG: OmpA family protein [Alphaproteobacteria bacterium]